MDIVFLFFKYILGLPHTYNMLDDVVFDRKHGVRVSTNFEPGFFIWQNYFPTIVFFFLLAI